MDCLGLGLQIFLFKHMEWIYGTNYDTGQLIYMAVHFQLEQVVFKDKHYLHFL